MVIGDFFLYEWSSAFLIRPTIHISLRVAGPSDANGQGTVLSLQHPRSGEVMNLCVHSYCFPVRASYPKIQTNMIWFLWNVIALLALMNKVGQHLEVDLCLVMNQEMKRGIYLLMVNFKR
jgi:hypothetical protein